MGYIRQEYIRQEYTWPDKKAMRFRSRAKRKNHITIVCDVDSKDTQEIVRKEIQEAVRRMNCLLKSKISYDGIII